MTAAAVGVVVIGRNEGLRLQLCLDSVPRGVARVVYVDSASTDDSVEQARRRGAHVVALDMTLPFTAARARNAGLDTLRTLNPGLEYVQLIDGDCSLAPGWIEDALSALAGDPRVAIVCGRRRERHRAASIYNKLCDLEWDTPVGEALSCGGDALARLPALEEVGDYDPDLIAGEEPELCARLRARGWRIRRLPHEMTQHDAAMVRFSQWWRRAVRAGHARAEVSSLHPPLWRRELRSIFGWGVLLPAAALLLSPLSHGGSFILLAGYGVLWARVLLRRRVRGDRLPDCAVYASACVVGKFAEAFGASMWWWNNRRGVATGIIEYK